MSEPEYKVPKGIREIVSKRTGKSTFEAGAGLDENGDKIRASFSEVKCGSKLAALADAVAWKKEIEIQKRRKRRNMTGMDHKVILDELTELLKPYNLKPYQAIRDYVEILEAKRVAEQVTWEEAGKRFIRSKRLERCKESYIRDIRIRLESFDFLNNQLLESVSHVQLREDLEDREIGAVNWNNNVRNLRVFFAWCMNQQPRIISHNPALQLETQKVDEEEVEILEVSQTRKVLKTAMETPELRRQVPWFVLGMFCGMRKDEADRAEWGDIDWETNTIKVRSAKLRSMSTRYVELTEPAKSFFKLLQNGERMVVGRNARWVDIKLLSEKTGLELNKNLYRHSYGSYFLATHGNAQMVMTQMGHSNLRTFVNHYRRPIPKTIAEAYWQISPTNLG